MAVTGTELYNKWNQRIDAAYTGYLDTTKANRLFRVAYINVIQSLYDTRLNQQNSYDQLSYLVALDVQRVPSPGNTIFHRPVPVTALTYILTVITVTTEIPHGLVPGDTFIPRNLAGTLTLPTDLNGIAGTVTAVISPTSFQYDIGVAPAGVHTANTGQLELTQSFYDYLHLLFARTRFIEPTYLSISDATNTSPIRIVFTKRNRFRTGDYLRIAGVLGNTNTNGDHYVKQMKERIYGLYSDENFQTPITGNGAYISGGSVSEIVTATVKDKKYDQKGNIYGDATALNPRVQQGLLQFKIYPASIPCDQVTFDYIRKPPAEIDAANNTIDLERYYPLFFLDRLVDEAVKIFGFEVRDGNLVGGANELIIENP